MTHSVKSVESVATDFTDFTDVLEIHLQCELDQTGVVRRVRDESELARRDVSARSIEIRVIHQIEELCSEFRASRLQFRQFCFLDNRKIDIGLTRARQNISSNITESCSCANECSGVEVFVQTIANVAAQRGRTNSSVGRPTGSRGCDAVQRRCGAVGDADRQSGLNRQDPRKLPALKRRGPESWQIVNKCAHGSVLTVEIRDRASLPEIRLIPADAI